MKKHLFLLITIFTFSLLLASCGTAKNQTNSETNLESDGNQNEKEMKEELEDDTNELVEKNNVEQPTTEPENTPLNTELSDEEIEEIVADTYSKILTISENREISFYEAIENDLMAAPEHSVDIDNLLIHGIDPQSALYQTVYDYFSPEIQQYAIGIGINLVLADHLILYINPRNDTPLSPKFTQFQVLEKNEDQFIVKHWDGNNEHSNTYKTTFILVDSKWKYLTSEYTNR